MGSQIINAIKDGLGLIGDLAAEFLDGFKTLMLDTTGGSPVLTSFAIFAFVMLGISITMAVVSLVLNLIRGNTGA